MFWVIWTGNFKLSQSNAAIHCEYAKYVSKCCLLWKPSFYTWHCATKEHIENKQIGFASIVMLTEWIGWILQCATATFIPTETYLFLLAS